MEQATLLKELFSSSSVIELDGEYNSSVGKAYRLHQSSLKTQHDRMLKEGNNQNKVLFPFLFLFISTGLLVLLSFIAGYSEAFSVWYAIPYFFIGIIFIAIYAWLIKKPSLEKLDLQSRIRGFKMYLGLAEKDRMDVLNPPEMTVGHFEKLLPYAFALGVENKWMKMFDNVLKDSGYYEQNPHVSYYSDQGFSRSFNNSLSSTSTQPSSSSSGGSGGGGFSGGGGGGGGVGGW